MLKKNIVRMTEIRSMIVNRIKCFKKPLFQYRARFKQGLHNIYDKYIYRMTLLCNLVDEFLVVIQWYMYKNTQCVK